MTRANRHVAEAKPFEQLAHGALVKRDAEPRRNHIAKIDAAPAHDAVGGDIGTALHDPGKFGLLLLRQPWHRPRSLAVDKPIDAQCVVAVYPVA